MKILVVCQYYYPEAFKVTEVCEELVKRGNDVTVLTGLPNYPVGIVPDEYKNGSHNDEVINGVHVVRCYERGRAKGAVNLALNYASFYFSAMKLIKKMPKDFDIVFSYQLSPIFMSLPAIWYKNKRHVPMFLYCCDLWPESLKVYLSGENNPVFKWVKGVSRKVYKSADAIGTQSDIFVDYLMDVHHIKKEKLRYIPNFSNEEYLEMDLSKKTDTDVTDFVFTGNVGIAQDLEDVITAFSKICNNYNTRFHIVGGGARLEAIKKLASDLDISDKVIFYGQRPVEEMPSFYEKADVCVVSLKADNAIGMTLPAKVQGYMAVGKPILGMINGSCNTIVNNEKCGICVNAGDIGGFADAMKKLCEDKEKVKEFGINSREYFINNFRKEIHIDAIVEEIEKLINS